MIRWHVCRRWRLWRRDAVDESTGEVSPVWDYSSGTTPRSPEEGTRISGKRFFAVMSQYGITEDRRKAFIRHGKVASGGTGRMSAEQLAQAADYVGNQSTQSIHGDGAEEITGQLRANRQHRQPVRSAGKPTGAWTTGRSRKPAGSCHLPVASIRFIDMPDSGASGCRDPVNSQGGVAMWQQQHPRTTFICATCHLTTDTASRGGLQAPPRGTCPHLRRLRNVLIGYGEDAGMAAIRDVVFRTASATWWAGMLQCPGTRR